MKVGLVSNARSVQTVSSLRRSAMAGDAGSQHELGWCYYSGKGVKPDYSQAAHWWSQSAEQGFVQARFDLAVMFHTNSDGEREPVMPWARCAVKAV